ncbi:MAG TPA: hypothetical protein VFX70_14040 [Mycobacteriales bacterium]|nr:hypothetical protein [Mycobacteriales bacterium]
MTLLPAAVPETPRARVEIVPARLAGKVAPLFGICPASSPYGLTWVCDYSKLTLSEIARGAPGPTRAEAARWGGQVPPGGWRVVDRAVVTHRRPGAAKPEPLRGEIANATLNRFGPDTKAAVILTAANTLLEPVTRAIVDALAFLADVQPPTVPVRLVVAGWAALVLEAFRSQPALFAAALQARAIQRAALLRWRLPASERWPLARSELSEAETDAWIPGSAVSPTDFHVIDSTLAQVRLPRTGPRRTDPTDVRRARLTGALAGRWVERLLALGTPEGDGYLWLTEREPGTLVVEAFTPYDLTLHNYLTDIDADINAGIDVRIGTDVGPDVAAARPAWAGHGWDGGPDHAGGESDRPHRSHGPATAILPHVPDPAEVAELDVLTRRAIIIALGTMTWLAFNQGDPDPDLLGAIHGTLDRLALLARACLPVNDPVRAVTLCRIATVRLEALRQDEANDDELGAVVAGLTAQVDRCVELAGQGVLNRGDAAELIRSANVDLAILLRRHTASPVPGLPPAGEFTEDLGRSWQTFLDLMEIDLDRLPEKSEVVRHLVGFHLQNYASFLCGRGRTEAEVRRGYDLFERLVIPAREAFHRRTGNFVPLLNSYQNVTRATSRLAGFATSRGDLTAARRYAERGRDWIGRARRHPETVRKLERATDAACRFVLLAAPALLTAVELGTTDSVAEDLAECEQLLTIAQAFADGIAKTGGRYARADEITEIERRLRTCQAAARTG